jgi:ribosomal protein L31E
MSTDKQEANKRKAAEKIWLSYFNEYLYERGLIDEKTRNTMRVRIEAESRK